MTDMIVIGDDSAKSAPEILEQVSFGSFQAQKVMKRSFEKLNEALFSIGVRLQILCDDDEIEQVEGVVNDYFANTLKMLTSEKARLEKMTADNGIEAKPNYSNSVSYQVSIKSPQTAMFLGMMNTLEELVALVDTLWLNSVLTSKQRKDATYQFQQAMIRLAGKVIGTEKRVRLAAYKKNGDAEEAAKTEQEIKQLEAEEGVEEKAEKPAKKAKKKAEAETEKAA